MLAPDLDRLTIFHTATARASVTCQAVPDASGALTACHRTIALGASSAVALEWQDPIA